MISVLIAAYNEDRHIRETIQSILSQDYPEFEIIVVDDGSLDNTYAILQQLQKEDVRLKCYSPGKLGKNGAYNYAAEIASGEWFMLFAGDDLLEPGIFSRWMEAANSIDYNKKVILASRIRMFSDDNEFTKYDGIEIPKNQDDVCRSGSAFLGSQAVMQSVFPLPTNYPNEDTWISLYMKYLLDDFIPIPMVCTNYRIHSGNSLKRNLAYSDFNEQYHRRASIGKDFIKRYSEYLSNDQIEEIRLRDRIEALRYNNQTFRILFYIANISFIERMRNVVLSSKSLYKMKQYLDRYMLGH